MGKSHSLPRLSVLALLISQAFVTLPAFAAGFQVNEISASLQGAALAGAAAANNDVSAMFFNPALLATMQQDQFYLGASEIMPTVRMSDASAIHTVNLPGLPLSGISFPVTGSNSQSNISRTAFVPDLYLSWRLMDNLVAGIALVVPYGLTTNYHRDSVVRFAATNTSIKSVNINPAIAYAFSPQWSLGVGFQAQYLKGSFSNYDGAFTGTPLDTLVSATHPTHLWASRWGYGYTLGLLWQPDLCTRLGLGFRSQVAHDLTGNGQQFTFAGPLSDAPSVDFLANLQTTTEVGVRTPAVLNLSGQRDYYNLTVKGTVQVNFWNSLQQLTIHAPEAFANQATFQYKWKDAWFASLGADYRWDCHWTFRGGVAYDQTPTQDAYRDPRLPDSDRWWLAIGATYTMTPHFSFDAAYEHIFFIDQTVNVTQAFGQSATSTVPLEVNQVHANYSANADIAALALRYSF